MSWITRGMLPSMGHPCNEVEYSLSDKSKVIETCPVSLCPNCFAQIPVGSPECPECGYVRPVEDRKPPTEDTGVELVEVAPVDEEKAWYTAKVLEADTLRFKIGWARLQFKNKYGRWPRYYKIEDQNYRCLVHQVEENEWGAKKCVVCRRTVG